METVQRKKYELPLFNAPLLGLRFFSGDEVGCQKSRDEDTGSGNLHVKETAPNTGRAKISVIHKKDDERVGRYRFDIMDQDKRICRYAGSDQPPWSVFYAVTQFGFHCQTAPRSERKYAFDLLHAMTLELIHRVQQQEYEYSVGWGFRLFQNLWHYIILAAFEYQVGPEHMEDVVSTLAERQVQEAAVPIFEKYDIENGFLPHSPRHPSARALLSDTDSPDSTTEHPDSEDQPETENPIRVTTVHRGRREYENVLFVSIIGSDAIDRFSFQITDEETNKCVAQTNVAGDLPPYVAIKSIQEEWEITNIPSVAYNRENIPYSEFLIDLDRVVRRTTKEFSPESNPAEAALDNYLATLSVYLNVVAAYEKAPHQYNRGVTKSFSILGIELSIENIIKLSHNNLDQISLASFQTIDNLNAVQQFAQELMSTANTEERRRLDIPEKPDIPLAAHLSDWDVSLYD